MANFLENFPRVSYDINRGRNTKYSTYITSVNITARIAFIKEVLANAASYYKYTIKDGDTPEKVANKVYGDPEAHWMVLYANDIYDPHYDWPLEYSSFISFIEKKYGSVEYAQTNYHHYEKVITREVNEIITEQRMIINKEQYTDNDTRPDLPFAHDYYYDDIADEQSFTAYNLNGRTVKETISRHAISYYDYENELNESKREIIVIKPIYYQSVMKEFNEMLNPEVNNLARVLF